MSKALLPEVPEVGSKWVDIEDDTDRVEVVGTDLAPDGYTYIVIRDLNAHGLTWHFKRAAFFEAFKPMQKQYSVTWEYQIAPGAEWHKNNASVSANSKIEAAFKAGLGLAGNGNHPRRNIKVTRLDK